MSDVLNGPATLSGRCATTLMLALPCSPGAGSGWYAWAAAGSMAKREHIATRPRTFALIAPPYDRAARARTPKGQDRFRVPQIPGGGVHPGGCGLRGVHSST